MADEQGPVILYESWSKKSGQETKRASRTFTCCSGSPYSLSLRSLLEYSLDLDSHKDRLFCRPCKRLRVFVGSNIFHRGARWSCG